MSKKYSWHILAGSLFILGLSVGFFAGRNLPTPKLVLEPLSTPLSTDDFYSSQMASIRGDIIKIDGKNLTVKNLNNNVTGNVVVSDSLIITKPGASQPTSDLSALELNKEALIGLEMINGDYRVITIRYIFPAPSLPPVPSAAVKPLKATTQPASTPSPAP